MNYMRAIVFFAICLLAAAIPASSEQSHVTGPVVAPVAATGSVAVGSAASTGSVAVVAAEDAPVDVQADEMEYEADQKLMTARGHVVVTRGKDVLKADYMTVRTDTQDAHAVGNVVFDREGRMWKGDEMSYNFKARTGDFGQFNATVAP